MPKVCHSLEANDGDSSFELEIQYHGSEINGIMILHVSVINLREKDDLEMSINVQ